MNLFNLFSLLLLGILLGKFTEKRFLSKRISCGLFVFANKVALPCFILTSLQKTPFSSQHLTSIVISVLGVIFISFLGCFILGRLMSLSARKLYLPSMFMNAGGLGIPLCTLLFSDEGATYAVLYNMVVSITLFTLGVCLITGINREIFFRLIKLPVIYAYAIGLTLVLFKLQLSPALYYPISKLAIFAIPLLVLTLGYDLGQSKLLYENLKLGIIVSFLRAVLGCISGWLMSEILSLEGTLKKVIILESSMPSALMSYLVARTHKVGEDIAAAAFICSTSFSAVFIPIVVFVILR